VPALVDTTIRLLSQEPLAARVPTGELLRLAEILDGAGFASLEVSGGGVFDSAVRRGVESPWERIRALKARTTTPLGLALRGRFLVGSRPIGGDFVRRFVASAAESGVDVFRLHDPLNDVSNLREAGEAIAAAGGEFDAGLVYGSGYGGEIDALAEQARILRELGADRVLVHDPSGSLKPHAASELVARLREESQLPVGLFVQGAGGNALATALEAARGGADRISCAVYPVALALHRVSGESLADALAGLGIETGIDVAALWNASELLDQHMGDEPVTPLAPRIAVRAAEHRLPTGLVAALDAHLRAHAAGDRIDEVLDELARVRGEAGWPPLAAPIGQILASQALVHVLAASRYGTVLDELGELLVGRYGSPPGPVDPTVRRAVELLGATPVAEPLDLEELRSRSGDIAASEEDLLLLALFGEDAEPLLTTIRSRGRRDDSLVGGSVDQARAERIRELVRIVQESGVSEISVDESGTRVSVRRSEERPAPATEAPRLPAGELEAVEPYLASESNGFVRVEAPMVGTFYRAPEPGAAPYVEEGDVVANGQTLCILEAMKLMNEIKSEVEGIVRAIHVRNAEPVEFGQLLFELEPLTGRPLDAV
jgi:oxaloacetate decarboxylase (Na+ extruding) subunit alpha